MIYVSDETCILQLENLYCNDTLFLSGVLHLDRFASYSQIADSLDLRLHNIYIYH